MKTELVNKVANEAIFYLFDSNSRLILFKILINLLIELFL